MATTNTKDDVRKNGSKTLVWRMQRGDLAAYAEAMRRLEKTKRQHTVSVLEPACEAFVAKHGTVVPAPTPAPVPTTARTTRTVSERTIPAGYAEVWEDGDILVLKAVA